MYTVSALTSKYRKAWQPAQSRASWIFGCRPRIFEECISREGRSGTHDALTRGMLFEIEVQDHDRNAVDLLMLLWF